MAAEAFRSSSALCRSSSVWPPRNAILPPLIFPVYLTLITLLRYIVYMPTKKKGAPVAEKRIITKLPEPVYRALKVRSAETDIDMQEIITEALKRHLGIKEGGDPTKK
jgi:hypothetical protein